MKLTRRELIKAGSLALSFAAAGGLAQRTAGASRPCARAVILLWMDGGPSQLESFDPKPFAPPGLRSELGTIRTAVAGVHVCDLLPRMARTLRRCTLVRTLSHGAGSHERACQLFLTGKRCDPATIHPSLGSVVAAELGGVNSLPAYVCIHDGRFASGFGGSGHLGPRHGPASIDSTTFRATGAAVSPALTSALAVHDEPERTLRLYGRHAFGRSCLMARRLVEDGVRFVTVSYGGWDTHYDNADHCKALLPPLDEGMSALIEDLYQRGLLDDTLVVWMGEFGRTPQLNPLGGRDHWPHAGCALFAGAGVPDGQVIGATDSGGMPVDRTVSPEDVAATILGKLGVSLSAPDMP